MTPPPPRWCPEPRPRHAVLVMRQAHSAIMTTAATAAPAAAPLSSEEAERSASQTELASLSMHALKVKPLFCGISNWA